MSQVYIDDVDGSVTYSGDWRSSTDDMRSHDNTIHFSNSVNSQASLTFTGISVMAYGVVRAGETPQSSYSLDGGNPTFLQSTSGVISQYGVLLYTSPSLRNAQHILVITNLGNESTFFIDYFAIVTAGAASTNPSTSTTLNISPTSSVRPGTTSGTPSGTTNSSNSSSNSSSSSSSSSSSGSGSSSRSSTSPGSHRSPESGSSSSFDDVPSAITPSSNTTNFNSAPGATITDSRHIAAIIGSVTALSIVAVFIIAFLWLRRRRRKKKDFESWIINSFSGGAVAPIATSFPVVTRQISEELPPFPPRYAISEPPAYDATVAPAGAAQYIDTQRFGSSGRLEKGSMITTQSSGGTPTSSNDRNNETN